MNKKENYIFQQGLNLGYSLSQMGFERKSVTTIEHKKHRFKKQCPKCNWIGKGLGLHTYKKHGANS